MVDHRNLTTLAYDETMAEEIVQCIPTYTSLLETLLGRLKCGQ